MIFSNPQFLLLWLGQVLSQAGIRMYQIAIIWWVLTSCGGSGREVGIFMVMGALPSILFVKVIGRTIDRSASKRVLVTCDLLASLVAGAVALLLAGGRLSLGGVYAAGFLTALMQAFVDPALNRAVAELVCAQEIERAVAFQASTQSLANFGGAVAGALLIDRLGILGVVCLNAVTYLLAAACNLLIRFQYDRALGKAAAEAGQATADGLSGWRLLDGMPLIRKILVGFGCVNFFATPTLVILPLYTNKTLHAGPAVLGTLEASLWIGILLGTFSSAWFDFIRSTIKLGAGCLFVLGGCLFIPGLIVNSFLYMALLFVAGFALGVNNVKFVSLFQRTVRHEIKGRFFALMQAMIGFTFPVAYFLFGLLTDRFSPPAVCLIQGAGVAGLAVFFLSLADRESELRPA